MTKMKEWQKEDFLEFGNDYDRARSKREILSNRKKMKAAEEILYNLEKFDSENIHWYEQVGEEENGQFNEFPGELKNYEGRYLNLNEQRFIRYERNSLAKIRELIGFHEYHSNNQQDEIVKTYLIYRHFGISTSMIAHYMNKKLSYFRSDNFVGLKINNGNEYSTKTIPSLNSQLHEKFDKK